MNQHVLPERAIDYREKYLSHLSTEDFVHVMRVISLAVLEGEINNLRSLNKATNNCKDIKPFIKKQSDEKRESLRAMCEILKIHYNQGVK
jgi:hypothetical protein